MEPWIAGLIGTTFIVFIQIVLIAYSYGAINTKVSTLIRRVDDLADINETIAVLNSTLTEVSNTLVWVSETVRKCPTCNRWTIIKGEHE